MNNPASPATGDNPLQGILWLSLALICFAIMNTGVKYLVDFRQMPVTEVVWGRYVFHLLLIILIFPRRAHRLLESDKKHIQIIRSFLVMAATLCTFTSLQYIQLADMVSISFTAPLMVTGLSVWLLKEKVGIRRWIAVIVGLCGVLVIVQPGGSGFHWAMILPVGMAFFLAWYQITTRIIRGAAPPINSLFYTALLGALAMTVILPFNFRWPEPLEWGVMVMTGFFGGLGHFLIIRAFERAEASTLAPYSYTELIWVTLFGIMFFDKIPSEHTMIGAAIIIASGCYVFYRDRLKSRR